MRRLHTARTNNIDINIMYEIYALSVRSHYMKGGALYYYMSRRSVSDFIFTFSVMKHRRIYVQYLFT